MALLPQNRVGPTTLVPSIQDHSNKKLMEIEDMIQLTLPEEMKYDLVGF